MSRNNNGSRLFERPGAIVSVCAVILVVIIIEAVLYITKMNTPTAPATPTQPVPTSAMPTASVIPTPTVSASPAPTTQTSATPASQTPSSTPSQAPSSSTAPADNAASICGLAGVVESGSVDTAPDADWESLGAYSYPSSSVYGPGAQASEGYYYCFQHSPTGAVFAAANAFIQSAAYGTNDDLTKTWSAYFLAPGPYHDTLVSQAGTQNNPYAGIKDSIAGFRLTSYDGSTATVGLAAQGTYYGFPFTVGVELTLKWSDGDWKLSTDTSTASITGNLISGTSGYIPWGP